MTRFKAKPWPLDTHRPKRASAWPGNVVLDYQTRRARVLLRFILFGDRHGFRKLHHRRYLWPILMRMEGKVYNTRTGWTRP
jgi:hypothetical protein